jgi:hypothetical protein
MGITGPTPGGNTNPIGRRDVLALAASAAIGGAPNRTRAVGRAKQLDRTAPYAAITLTSWQ